MCEIKAIHQVQPLRDKTRRFYLSEYIWVVVQSFCGKVLSLKKYFDMPTISMFFGIIIRMYYAPKEYNPPHVHAYYQDFKTTIRILDCEIIDGEIPSRQLRLIQAWIEIHRDELMADWKLCQNGEKPFQIEPLK